MVSGAALVQNALALWQTAWITIVLCIGARDLLQAYKIFNFNIFLQKMPDGKFYEFGYYEYHGTDYDADMARLAQEPRNIAWLKQTDATQVPFERQKSWTVMQRMFLTVSSMAIFQ
jgi:L-rhamnose mutarotase